jgi:hypothetical protein
MLLAVSLFVRVTYDGMQGTRCWLFTYFLMSRR